VPGLVWLRAQALPAMLESAPTSPSGTFLFTEIEGSTWRWEHQRAAVAVAALGPELGDLRVRMGLHAVRLTGRDRRLRHFDGRAWRRSAPSSGGVALGAEGRADAHGTPGL